MNNNYFYNYYNENKDTILERLSINQKRRYKEDIEFQLLKRIQARIKNKLPDYDGTVEQLLKCSLYFFYLNTLNLILVNNQIEITFIFIMLDQ